VPAQRRFGLARFRHIGRHEGDPAGLGPDLALR
jgi:hypothetical protein